jgi:hypothetical protein
MVVSSVVETDRHRLREREREREKHLVVAVIVVHQYNKQVVLSHRTANKQQ